MAHSMPTKSSLPVIPPTTETLAQLVSKHQLLASELFHLRNYITLQNWDPRVTLVAPKENFAHFIEDERLALPWITTESLDHLPLRLQRKAQRASTLRVDREAVEQRATLILLALVTPKATNEPLGKVNESLGKTNESLGKVNESLGKIMEPQGKTIVPREEITEISRGNPPRKRKLSMSELETEMEFQPVPWPVRKVRLRVRIHPAPHFHPSAVVPAAPSGDEAALDATPAASTRIEAFLDSFRSLDEDVTEAQFEQHVTSQAQLAARLRDLHARGFLALTDGRIGKVEPPAKFLDPLVTVPLVTATFLLSGRPITPAAAGRPTHSASLLAHAHTQANLVRRQFKTHRIRARRIAQMVTTYHRRKTTDHQREAQAEAHRVKVLARTTALLVRRRWAAAERAWRVLKERDEKERKDEEGRKALGEILERSQRLLLQQRGGDATRGNTDNMENMENIENMDNIEDSDDESGAEEPAIRALEEPNGELLLAFNERELAIVNEEYAKVASDSDDDLDSDMDEDEDEEGLEEEDEEMEMEEEDEEEEDEPSTLAGLFGSAFTRRGVESAGESVSPGVEIDDEPHPDTPIQTPRPDTPGAAQAAAPRPDTPGAAHAAAPRPDTPGAAHAATPRPDTPDSNDAVAPPGVALPSLLRGTLRTYQKQGLDWLASLYANNTNGILADEMGLGKTIQTISLLAHLACHEGNWGPHLIIVPTSVMLNWEMEFKRFAPGFKVMTYYGTPLQRKEKRRGWQRADLFHVCITSYQLVCHDQQVFRRRQWQYMILDEAHNIKNFRSQRWQALLNFNTANRLLLTGTPLQNNIGELWSLLYFLMPSRKWSQAMPAGFANLHDFQTWFGKPVDQLIGRGACDAETRQTVGKLHQVLRPFLLRRLKRDVEQQMPGKHEHVVWCRLSARQRHLYDEFMARAATKDTLRSGNFLSIINCLMQLRKVCNHPDLFEERPIRTSLVVPALDAHAVIERAVRRLAPPAAELGAVSAAFAPYGLPRTTVGADAAFAHLLGQLDEAIAALAAPADENEPHRHYRHAKLQEQVRARHQVAHRRDLNAWRCARKPLIDAAVVRLVLVVRPVARGPSLADRCAAMRGPVERFAFATPRVVALEDPSPDGWFSPPQRWASEDQQRGNPAPGITTFIPGENPAPKITTFIPRETPAPGITTLTPGMGLPGTNPSVPEELTNPFHHAQTKLAIAFPEKSLLQYDCGKLQKLAVLLQNLKDGGHRALIFTQMTKVLDILERFMSIHGYRYLRLDGSTKIEDRQLLTDNFNKDPRITCFILSSRSGGLGINLTGADTVIFYDSDWNPAMDKQCQDRCHRIGQTRDVHIYRLVSEFTIESNILKKANQKRELDNIVIQDGDFTTDYFGKLSVRDMLGDAGPDLDDAPLGGSMEIMAQAEDAEDAAAASSAMREVAVDDEDFAEVVDGQLPERSVAPEPEAVEPLVVEADDDWGHVDEYMLRFIKDGLLWE